MVNPGDLGAAADKDTIRQTLLDAAAQSVDNRELLNSAASNDEILQSLASRGVTPEQIHAAAAQMSCAGDTASEIQVGVPSAPDIIDWIIRVIKSGS